MLLVVVSGISTIWPWPAILVIFVVVASKFIVAVFVKEIAMRIYE